MSHCDGCGGPLLVSEQDPNGLELCMGCAEEVAQEAMGDLESNTARRAAGFRGLETWKRHETEGRE